jgi:NAD(P)-dependent dehydrogenase (short-subunit alcohol dehydrogenase family)
MSSHVWFITGASRGFGLEIARAALERGHSVVATARNPEAVGRALGPRDDLLAVELEFPWSVRRKPAIR